MSTKPFSILTVSFTDENLVVKLDDGREVSTNLLQFPRLSEASAEDLERWELAGGGLGLYWPTLDEDISLEWLFGKSQ